MKVRIGTRGSALALVQAHWVAERLDADVELKVIRTTGDEGRGRHAEIDPRDKSRFVKEIEEALRREEVDLAVHSAKDVPGALPDGLAIVGVPEREDARDALVGASSLDDLHEGANVGTSSLRRHAQLLAARPDLNVQDLRGNVDTRLRKLADGAHDAVVLAMAGLKRLERDDGAAPLDVIELTPAPGQGCLALEARRDDEHAAELAASLTDAESLIRLTAERALVERLDASCHTPVGAYAEIGDDGLLLTAFVGMPDGSHWIRDAAVADTDHPTELGVAVAERLLAAGAGDVLEEANRLAAGA